MIRSRTLTGLLLLSGVALTSAGCQEWAGFGLHQEPGSEPAAVESETAPAPALAAGTVPEAADPHREETVAQVRQFVDRLSVSDAEGRSSNRITQPDSPRLPMAQVRTPPVQPMARANGPLDVTAAEDGQPVDGGEPAVALPDEPVIQSVFIRDALVVGEAESPADRAGAANNPLTTDPPLRALTVDQMLDALGARVAQSPEDTAALWELRMLQLAVGDDHIAREIPEGLSGEYADLLGGLMEVILAGRAALDNPVTASDAALEAVTELRNILRERADLLIPTVALCTRVQAFGVYDEMASDALAANRTNRAIVYLEIRNFLSEKTGDGQYRTALRDELEVLTADGKSVWRHEEPEITDLSRQQREDFFLAQMITLPATLGPGEYVLKVTIQDTLSGKSNQAILPFTLGSTSMAASGY